MEIFYIFLYLTVPNRKLLEELIWSHTPQDNNVHLHFPTKPLTKVARNVTRPDFCLLVGLLCVGRFVTKPGLYPEALTFVDIIQQLLSHAPHLLLQYVYL